MKIALLIALLLAGCAGQSAKPIQPTFPECPGLLPTPQPIGTHETIVAFEVRIELAREEAVKRHGACLIIVMKLREWIAQH